jgi:hypothetical protein
MILAQGKMHVKHTRLFLSGLVIEGGITGNSYGFVRFRGQVK